MGQHLGHGPLQAEGRGGGDRQHQQTHVPKRAVGHQTTHVRLGNGIEGAIDGTDGPDGGDPGRPGRPGLRQKANAETQQAIGAELRNGTTHQHHHRRRGLGIGERLPAVQRHHGQLQPEGQQQQGQDPALGGRRQRGGGELVEAETEARLVQPAQGEHRRQQGQTGDGPIEKEADGRSGAPLPAPDGHQQGGGDQDQLVGQHEQQGVAGEERPHQAHIGGEQQREEQTGPVLLGGSRQHRQSREQRGQHHQGQRQAIEAEVEGQAEAGQPGLVQRRRRLAPAQQRQQQLGQRGDQGEAAHQGGAAIGQQGEQQGGQQRQTRQQQQEGGGHQRRGRKDRGVGRVSNQAAISSTPSTRVRA